MPQPISRRNLLAGGAAASVLAAAGLEPRPAVAKSGNGFRLTVVGPPTCTAT